MKHASLTVLVISFFCLSCIKANEYPRLPVTTSAPRPQSPPPSYSSLFGLGRNTSNLNAAEAQIVGEYCRLGAVLGCVAVGEYTGWIASTPGACACASAAVFCCYACLGSTPKQFNHPMRKELRRIPAELCASVLQEIGKCFGQGQ